jgi:hypothetical protein
MFENRILREMLETKKREQGNAGSCILGAT